MAASSWIAKARKRNDVRKDSLKVALVTFYAYLIFCYEIYVLMKCAFGGNVSSGLRSLSFGEDSLVRAR